MPQHGDYYLAVERDFAGVEGHQDVVDDHGDVVGREEKHEQNLREKLFTRKNEESNWISPDFNLADNPHPWPPNINKTSMFKQALSPHTLAFEQTDA